MYEVKIYKQCGAKSTIQKTLSICFKIHKCAKESFYNDKNPRFVNRFFFFCMCIGSRSYAKVYLNNSYKIPDKCSD